MKTLLILFLAFAAIGARAQALNTFVVGNSSPTNSLIVSGKACKLFAVTGQNLSGSTEYVQVFQTNAVPQAGAVPTFSVPVPASPQYFSIDFSYYGADLSRGCVIEVSTTATSLTAANGGSSTVQAIIRAN